MSSDRGGRHPYPEDQPCSPDRWRLTAGACRFAAASPCTQPCVPSTGISLNEASTRVQAIRTSGRPHACGRPGGTGRPWALASGFALRRPEPDDACRGGDRPSNTDLELPLNSHFRRTPIRSFTQYVRPRVARPTAEAPDSTMGADIVAPFLRERRCDRRRAGDRNRSQGLVRRSSD